MAPPRHLEMLEGFAGEQIAWPVPYADGFPMLEGLRGRQVVVLASGDPFWFGAGASIAARLDASDWTCIPAPSTFALVASRMGWSLQSTQCHGLHAAPFARLRRDLAPGRQMIVLLRDGEAPLTLAQYLTDLGFGDSHMTILESVGGPEEQRTSAPARDLNGTFAHPVCAAVEVAGDGPALTAATGQSDEIFETDGQITKRPIRAITLSTLAPKPGEHLWDVGGGSGSIGLEWLLADATTTATSIEPRADRAARIRQNAENLGVAHRMNVIDGGAPEALAGLPTPDAVFIGGGLTQAALDVCLATRARLVANVVTLEGEVLLTQAQATHGGSLLRIDLAQAAPLGPKTGWKASYPVVQWSLPR